LQRLRKRLAAEARFIEPCLPSPAEKPPSGSNWIHEIKHDGYRLMARRDPVGIRLITRRGNDWTTRYPLVMEAVNHLKVRSCLIDGEVVCCDEKGVAAFQPALSLRPIAGLDQSKNPASPAVQQRPSPMTEGLGEVIAEALHRSNSVLCITR
jgi:ATP-dependent DNA ligase